MATNAHVLTGSFGILPDFLQPTLPPPSLQRRKNTPMQGAALEILGHAIEYLMDSRMFDEHDAYANDDAIRILMSLSRSVFMDGDVVVPWRQRMQQGLMRRLRHQGR